MLCPTGVGRTNPAVTVLQRLHPKPHHTALLAAEFDADQVNGQFLGLVFVGVALVLDLLQGLALGG